MRRVLATAVVMGACALGTATVGAPAQAADCTGQPYAQITQPDDGQLVVNGGPIPIPVGQSLTISTTGSVDVVIDVSCVEVLDLVVTKTAPGDPTVIHESSRVLETCDEHTVTEPVEIGLDGGQYRFDVSGISCQGRKLRTDGHGGTVVDPPLPRLL